MSKIKIVTDSASDISYKNEDLYDVEVLPFTITLGDEEYVSRRDFDTAEFYEMLEEAEEIPTTKPLTSFEFGELFGDLFDQGYTDVIYVSVNSDCSDTYLNALQAKDQFFEDIPDAVGAFNIYCIDSKSYSAGYGYAVAEAAKMADRGQDVKDILRYLRDSADKNLLCFGLLSQKFARKSEIVQADSALVGGIIGLRPIMQVKDKAMETVDRVLGETAVIPAIVEAVTPNMEKGAPYYIIYGNDADLRDEAAAAMTEAVGYPPADSCQVGAVIACHTGPEVIGVAVKAR